MSDFIVQIFFLNFHLSYVKSQCIIKVSKKAKIRNQYTQVVHLTQNTICENDKNTRKHHIQEPRGQPFPAGDHKVARNRQESMTDNHKTQNNKKDPQKKHCLGMVSKTITGGLKHV